MRRMIEQTHAELVSKFFNWRMARGLADMQALLASERHRRCADGSCS
jgi:hypothetical protein